MKQICSQKSYRAKQMEWIIVRTKISRVAFVAGITLMALTYCMTEAVPLRCMVITGIAGSTLALVSMWWTGWGDQ